jgi:hypothetical protein
MARPHSEDKTLENVQSLHFPPFQPEMHEPDLTKHHLDLRRMRFHRLAAPHSPMYSIPYS